MYECDNNAYANMLRRAPRAVTNCEIIRICSRGVKWPDGRAPEFGEWHVLPHVFVG